MCAAYVLMLYDLNFNYCVSHFSSWKMLPKISLYLKVWHAVVEITKSIPQKIMYEGCCKNEAQVGAAFRNERQVELLHHKLVRGLECLL
jgi:hypothetical protein